MFNIILAVFMSLVLLFSTNLKSFITINYLLNKAEITELFCINKEKPKLECNGKCHLGKELAKENSDSDANPFSGKTSKTEIPQVIISEKVSDFSFKVETEIDQVQEIGYKSVLHPSLFTSKILHPPQLG